MSKYLIRGAMSPLQDYSVSDVLLRNRIGTNVGNLIYNYGVMRTVMTEDSSFEMDDYRLARARNEKGYIERINETYDAVLLPLADYFREERISSMHYITRNIKKLKVPVIVIGVGLRAPLEATPQTAFPCDDAVRAFVSAVLDHSAVIGTRGEFTREYLIHLGFPKNAVTVIGCPSLYTFGKDLHFEDPVLSPEDRININDTIKAPKKVHEFIRRLTKEYPNYHFVPQLLAELQEIYLGVPYQPVVKEKNAAYPSQIDDEIFTSDHARYFMSADSWIEYLRGAKLSVGSRFHGNVAAMLAGVPSLIIPNDTRMKELTDYHQLAVADREEINKKTRLTDLVEKADFHGVERCQEQNFNHYLDFLEKNGIDHIYKGGKHPARGEAPLDRELAKRPRAEPIRPASAVSPEEYIRRVTEYVEASQKLIEEVKSERNAVENIAMEFRKKLTVSQSSKETKSGKIRKLARRVKRGMESAQRDAAKACS